MLEGKLKKITGYVILRTGEKCVSRQIEMLGAGVELSLVVEQLLPCTRPALLSQSTMQREEQNKSERLSKSGLEHIQYTCQTLSKFCVVGS